jgi:hypothetical protein
MRFIRHGLMEQDTWAAALTVHVISAITSEGAMTELTLGGYRKSGPFYFIPGKRPSCKCIPPCHRLAHQRYSGQVGDGIAHLREPIGLDRYNHLFSKEAWSRPVRHYFHPGTSVASRSELASPIPGTTWNAMSDRAFSANVLRSVFGPRYLPGCTSMKREDPTSR